MKILPMVAAQARASGQLASAVIERIDDDGLVHVTLGDAPSVPARIAVPPGAASTWQPGTPVLVLLEDDAAPIIVSAILDRIAPPPVVELAAEQQLVLRVGDTTLTISADGTIAMHGERIDSEAEGIHRIKGAQVRIN